LETAEEEHVLKHMKLRAEPTKTQHELNHIPTKNVSSSEWQLKLFKAREMFLLNELASKLFLATEKGAPLFDTWMLRESDNVQALATAWGENMTIEQFDKAIQTAEDSLKPTLKKLFSLYALDRIVADGVFFLQNGFVSAEQSEHIQKEIQRLCSELGENALGLTRGFGIPDHMRKNQSSYLSI
jgi:hypothetical protein